MLGLELFRIGFVVILGPFRVNVWMQHLMLRYTTLTMVETAVSRQECGEYKYRLRLIRFVPPPQVGVPAYVIGSSALAVNTNLSQLLGELVPWCGAGCVTQCFRRYFHELPRCGSRDACGSRLAPVTWRFTSLCNEPTKTGFWTLAERVQIRVSAAVLSLSCNCVRDSRQINSLNTKRRPLYLKTQFVPRSKHFSSLL